MSQTESPADYTERDRLATLGRLSAELAHELRQPLTVLQGCLTLLDQEIKKHIPNEYEKFYHYLAHLQEAMAWALRITLAISTASRPLCPVFRPVDISDLLVHACVLVDPQARSQQVIVDLLQKPGLAVKGDPGQLLSVVLNLATNAIEAMPTGGALSFRARKDGGTVVLDVADTGPGIPTEIKDRIWEPFFTTKPNGTGLGLAIVRQLVEAHGGAISLSSRPGKGTTAQVRLPAALAPSSLTLGPLGPRQGPISAPDKPMVGGDGGEVPDGPAGGGEREST